MSGYNLVLTVCVCSRYGVKPELFVWQVESYAADR